MKKIGIICVEKVNNVIVDLMYYIHDNDNNIEVQEKIKKFDFIEKYKKYEEIIFTIKDTKVHIVDEKYLTTSPNGELGDNLSEIGSCK